MAVFTNPITFLKKANNWLWKLAPSFKVIFGTVIAYLLLGLYVYSVNVAISVVNCVSRDGCTTFTINNFTDGMVSALTTIGALVSALVITELAVTQPGDAPVVGALGTTSESLFTQSFVKLTTFVYLGIWLFTGLAAFVVGVMQHPKVLQPLTDLGQSWLGLAVAAGYAYFGVNTKQQSTP